MAGQWSEGHSTSILCVGASSGPEGLLASGSEGGEVTLWSQEGTIIGRLTLPGGEDSTSVVFSHAAPRQLYVSHGDAVSVLDPRNLKGPVEEFQGAGEEEINALSLNETGSALAVADDSGAVRVLELPGGKVCRTLRRHTNICSSVAFRPHRPNNLISAGLDMQVRERTICNCVMYYILQQWLLLPLFSPLMVYKMSDKLRNALPSFLKSKIRSLIIFSQP